MEWLCVGCCNHGIRCFFFFSDVSCERSEMAQEHALALEGCLGSFDDANGSAYCLAKWTCCVFFELHIMAFLGVQADGETKMCNKKHSLIILVYSRDLQQKLNWCLCGYRCSVWEGCGPCFLCPRRRVQFVCVTMWRAKSFEGA